MMAVITNTFYRRSTPSGTEAPAFNGTNSNSHVNVLAMNNIFDGSTDYAVASSGPAETLRSAYNGFSQIQYNLFFNNVDKQVTPNIDPADVSWTTNVGDFRGNVAPIIGDPSSRPGQRQLPAQADLGGDRRGPERDRAAPRGRHDLPDRRPAARQQRRHPDGSRDAAARRDAGPQRYLRRVRRLLHHRGSPQDRHPAGLGRLRLPGRVGAGPADRPERVSRDRPRPPATYNYAPISGQRDQTGLHPGRRPERRPTSASAAARSSTSVPFEFVDLHPPEVTGVTATPRRAADDRSPSTPSAARPGANQTPQTINVTFNHLIDPNSINASTVLLEASGGDGIFGNGNSSPTSSSTCPASCRIDERDQHADHQPGGSRADAEDRRVPADPPGQRLAGAQQPAGHRPRRREHRQRRPQRAPSSPLPSGDGFPGGNFYDTFIINTTPADRHAGIVQARPGQRHQHRRRLRHHLEPAQLRRDRSPSPTRRWCPWPARRRSSTSASRCRIRRQHHDLLRPDHSTRRTSSPTSGRTRAPGSPTPTGTSRSAWASTRPTTGLVTNTTPAARLAVQRRLERPADARCPAR